jgi:hypothetical protein
MVKSLRMSRLTWLALAICLACHFPAIAAPPPKVKHPNLLLNREEIEQVKAKIQRYPWAAALLDRLKTMTKDRTVTHMRGGQHSAIAYVLTNEKRYAEEARKELLQTAKSQLPKYAAADLRLSPPFGQFARVSSWAWSYDLIYDTLGQEDRQTIEKLLRVAAEAIVEGARLHTTTPNLVFDMHWQVGVVGYCLGDTKLIDWALNDRRTHGPRLGGLYPVLESMINDGHFWDEAPIYALVYDLHGMLALAEAARHYDGSDLYHYVSPKSGASIKNILDGYLHMAFPLEQTGVGGGSIRAATFGDGSTGYTPSGALGDTYLINPFHSRSDAPILAAELELAYKRYGDPGYAWLISLNPPRDIYVNWGRALWGLIALTHGEPLPEQLTPPPAPCGIYPQQGFAMLRSDESPRYWTSDAMAAVVRLNEALGHGHKDYFSLVLHGKGRLLYPDLNIIQYEPTFLNWTREGIAHNTLLVDGQSPQPGRSSTRHDFGPEVKFFAITGESFPDVTQTRVLLLTPEYLADMFQAADTQGQPRMFDWAIHGLGRLYPGNPAAYRSTHELLPHYWWIDNERGRSVDAAWQADWVQKSAGVTRGIQPFGPQWFDQTVGVRMMMLGRQGTEVYVGDGPLADGPPYHRLDGNAEGSAPMVLARRHEVATTFAAIHQPYDRRAPETRVRRLAESGDFVAAAVDGETFSDRLLVAFDPAKQHTIRAADGEVFTFRDYGYVRIAAGRVTVQGHVTGFRVGAPQAMDVTLTINGRPEAGRRDGDFLLFGTLGQASPTASHKSASDDRPAEQQAAVHYFFLPEEVHLKAGAAGQTTMHLRCVGRGQARGSLRLLPPKGIRVKPEAIELSAMGEGDEKVVPLRVVADEDAANALHGIRIEPSTGTAAAPGRLPVSVGVVVTQDHHIPLLGQTVIRAPGYTVKLDHHSGVCYYLLDAEGHRRHGRLHHTNWCYGIPALALGEQWVFRYDKVCRGIYDDGIVQTAFTGNGSDQVRLRYEFQEDCIVLSLVPPTHPDREYTMWLGNFDALGKPVHNGIEDRKDTETVQSDWLFLPHPVHRQGILLTPRQKTPFSCLQTAVNFPLRLGQKVSVRFATEDNLPNPEDKK